MSYPLTTFLSDLVSTGRVLVPFKLEPLSPEEKSETIILLRQLYAYDAMEMPLVAPPLDENAALWASDFLFKVFFFLMNRDAEEENIRESLTFYDGDINPSVIYSADLSFRYLPTALQLSKMLAPEDFLSKEIDQLTELFPFSGIGIKRYTPIDKGKPPLPDISMVLSHPSLAIAFVDRVIAIQDQRWLQNSEVHSRVTAALGAEAEQTWPKFSIINNSIPS